MKRFLRHRLTRQVFFATFVIAFVWAVNYYVSATAQATPEIAPVVLQTPVKEPMLEDVDLLVWARDAAISTYTYQADAIQNSLQNSANYFTLAGWQDFYTALRASHNLETIRNKKYTVSAKSLETPHIVERGVVDDAYSWRIQFPIEVLMSNSTDKIVQKLMITMKVRRTNTPTDRNGPGVAIEQFVAAPVASSSLPPFPA